MKLVRIAKQAIFRLLVSANALIHSSTTYSANGKIAHQRQNMASRMSVAQPITNTAGKV